MKPRKSAKVLDSALSVTKSSFTYKDPYQPKGTPIYKARNKVLSFFNMRVIDVACGDKFTIAIAEVYDMDKEQENQYFKKREN